MVHGDLNLKNIETEIYRILQAGKKNYDINTGIIPCKIEFY